MYSMVVILQAAKSSRGRKYRKKRAMGGGGCGIAVILDLFFAFVGFESGGPGYF